MVFEKRNTVTASKLIEEIRRYLDLVALIRDAGYEPSWRTELGPSECVPALRRTSNSTGRGVFLRPPRFTV